MVEVLCEHDIYGGLLTSYVVLLLTRVKRICWNWFGACRDSTWTCNIVVTNVSEVHGEHGGALQLVDCTQWDAI